jgi:hypothetical protein
LEWKSPVFKVWTAKACKGISESDVPDSRKLSVNGWTDGLSTDLFWLRPASTVAMGIKVDDADEMKRQMDDRG